MKKKALKIEMANIKNEALAYALKEQDWDTPKDIERKKYGGPVGVKMAKGGFKKKTPIY